MGLFDRVVDILKRSNVNETAPEIQPGRNEPCWCGSGKKYKKCHLHTEEKAAAAKACSLSCGPT
jgi:uncharacterized protein YecA (UPF0149 family)